MRVSADQASSTSKVMPFLENSIRMLKFNFVSNLAFETDCYSKLRLLFKSDTRTKTNSAQSLGDCKSGTFISGSGMWSSDQTCAPKGWVLLQLAKICMLNVCQHPGAEVFVPLWSRICEPIVKLVHADLNLRVLYIIMSAWDVMDVLWIAVRIPATLQDYSWCCSTIVLIHKPQRIYKESWLSTILITLLTTGWWYWSSASASEIWGAI